MKHSFLKSVTTALVFFAFANLTNAQVQIDVLATTYGAVPTSHIPQRMARIQEVLNNSGLGLGVSVNLIGNGFPVALTGNIGSPSLDSDRVENLISETDLTGFRDANHADLVVVFMPELQSPNRCGYTYHEDFLWDNGAGLVPISGPDLRMSETHFIALISTSTSGFNCVAELDIVAHEFGHLFGAAHQESLGQGPGLYSNSFADVRAPSRGQGQYTVMSSLGITPNSGPYPPCLYGSQCRKWDNGRFSSSSTHTNPPFEPNNNNTLALSVASYSVSLYRVPQQGCGLTTPVGVGGQIEDICYGGTETRHTVWWTDLCVDESDRYRLYKQQPSGTGSYSYFGTVLEPNLSTYVLVDGADSNIKVKACGGASCTPLSISKYLAEWVECH